MSDKNAARTPANQNRWYVLMTLYGEQDGEEIDAVLHERNREAWNTWAGFVLPEAIREDCAAKDMALPDRDMWHMRGAEIRTLHQSEMLRRNGSDFAYPGFPEASAPAAIDFSHVDFPGHFWAKKLVFPTDARFGSATFSGEAGFGSATFSGEAEFGSATFSGAAKFFSATFSGGAGFDFATFSGAAQFRSATFSGHVVFLYTTFSGEVEFGSATFSGAAWFFSATFSGAAQFRSATFGGVAGFPYAAFSRAAEFNSATFSGFTYFTNARFGAPGNGYPVTFTDCQFHKPTSFRAAIFHSQYPDLSGAVLHDKTEFTARSDNWPLTTTQPAEDAKAACARIRHAVAKQGLPEDEHFFYRREMTFASQIGSFWDRLPYQLFRAVSNFGHSLARPCLWLLGLWLLAGLVNQWVLQWQAVMTDTPYNPVQAFALSFANLFPIFGLQRLWFTPEFLTGLNPWLKALGGLQTVLSLPLLFFFGLGLRTRFRLR